MLLVQNIDNDGQTDRTKQLSTTEGEGVFGDCLICLPLLQISMYKLSQVG